MKTYSYTTQALATKAKQIENAIADLKFVLWHANEVWLYTYSSPLSVIAWKVGIGAAEAVSKHLWYANVFSATGLPTKIRFGGTLAKLAPHPHEHAFSILRKVSRDMKVSDTNDLFVRPTARNFGSESNRWMPYKIIDMPLSLIAHPMHSNAYLFAHHSKNPDPVVQEVLITDQYKAVAIYGGSQWFMFPMVNALAHIKLNSDLYSKIACAAATTAATALLVPNQSDEQPRMHYLVAALLVKCAELLVHAAVNRHYIYKADNLAFDYLKTNNQLGYCNVHMQCPDDLMRGTYARQATESNIKRGEFVDRLVSPDFLVQNLQYISPNTYSDRLLAPSADSRLNAMNVIPSDRESKALKDLSSREREQLNSQLKSNKNLQWFLFVKEALEELPAYMKEEGYQKLLMNSLHIAGMGMCAHSPIILTIYSICKLTKDLNPEFALPKLSWLASHYRGPGSILLKDTFGEGFTNHPNEAEIKPLLAKLAKQMKLAKIPSLYLSPPSYPAAAGGSGYLGCEPIIFMSEAYNDDMTETNFSLRHEMAHLKHEDIAAKSLLELACVLVGSILANEFYQESTISSLILTGFFIEVLQMISRVAHGQYVERRADRVAVESAPADEQALVRKSGMTLFESTKQSNMAAKYSSKVDSATSFKQRLFYADDGENRTDWVHPKLATRIETLKNYSETIACQTLKVSTKN